MDKHEYLGKFVFHGLTNLNDGFDAVGISYFSEADFETVLRRVEELGIGVCGIEPWKDKKYYDVRIFEDYKYESSDPRWYWSAFEEFRKKDKELLYAATFAIPEEKLNDGVS